MRQDITESVTLHLMNDTKPNYTALAKQFNCDPRTVKRYFDAGKQNQLSNVRKRRAPPSILVPYEGFITDKLEMGCSAKSIYYFLTKKEYTGSYITVNRYVTKYRKAKLKKATIRVETTHGLSAQVDWKENIKLISRNGEIFKVNLFLYVLGYSRMKYIELTVDRTQPTLFGCLNNAFYECGGVPQEIWFDNMKTVVNRSKSQFSRVVFNERFRQYSKDAGFRPIACRPFRPQTKGKVEALARTVDRLRVFNHEFDDLIELHEIVHMFMDDLNHNEPSQATGEPPALRCVKM